MLRMIVPALIAGVLTACYTYAPATVETVSPGEDVRARITPTATESLPVGLRPEDGVLKGELLDRDDGTLTLFVSAADRQEGFFTEDLRQRVNVSASDIVVLERRTLNKSRTYFATGVGIAVVTAVSLRILSGKAGGNTIDRPDPGPSATRIPLFILHHR